MIFDLESFIPSFGYTKGGHNIGAPNITKNERVPRSGGILNVIAYTAIAATVVMALAVVVRRGKGKGLMKLKTVN